jgi:hypothetical protein
MITKWTCGMDFVGVFAAYFVVAFFAFLQLAIVISFSIPMFKLIVESFLGCILFLWLVNWFRKLPRKPPDKFKVPFSKFPTFSLIVMCGSPTVPSTGAKQSMLIGAKQSILISILRLPFWRTFRHKLVRENTFTQVTRIVFRRLFN